MYIVKRFAVQCGSAELPKLKENVPNLCVSFVSYKYKIVYFLRYFGSDRATQTNFDHLLDSTSSIHLIPMVEFRWYLMYRGGRI